MGLHAAHELRDETDQLIGLVHRDVSPQNILVTYDGHVKLVDFGVAKATNRAGGETTAGQLKGKIPYMSPEQAKGGVVDRRTDIFAMGIVLYKLTTGVHPFAGDTDLVTMTKIISQPALPPRARNPSFSPELEQVLMKCLQKDPDKRYQTMEELERAVQAVLAKEGPAGDSDVAMFIRTLMGDRSQKRRSQLRDSIRLLDERASTPGHDAPLVHEGVSELVMTQMRSGVGRDLVPTRPGTPTAMAEMLPDSAVVSSPTHLPVELPAGRRRSGVVVAVAVAALTLVGVLGAGFIALSRGKQADVTPAPTTQPAAAPTVEEPRAEPSVAATAPTTSADSGTMDVNALPDKSAGGAEPDPRTARPDPRPGPGGKPSGAPTGGPNTKSTSKKYIPTIQESGLD
jgi:serine/threonine-protein kinase